MSTQLRYFVLIPIVIAVLSCTPPESVESSLQRIQSVISASNAYNTVRYTLDYDRDFPCQVSLQEQRVEDNVSWFERYRFDLTDIEASTFVQSKQGRRAIIYDGHKVMADGEKKLFRERRINNITYRAALADEDQIAILTEVNKAIALCEEKYSSDNL